MGINVAARRMKRAGFVDELDELLRATGANPRQMGLSLVLDDLGVGCSSLSYIRRYPIDRIKIDRGFVAPLGHDTDSEAGAPP